MCRCVLSEELTAEERAHIARLEAEHWQRVCAPIHAHYMRNAAELGLMPASASSPNARASAGSVARSRAPSAELPVPAPAGSSAQYTYVPQAPDMEATVACAGAAPAAVMRASKL